MTSLVGETGWDKHTDGGIAMSIIQGIPFKCNSNYKSICKFTGDISIVVLLSTPLSEDAALNTNSSERFGAK
jgi:hypothetical protein